MAPDSNSDHDFLTSGPSDAFMKKTHLAARAFVVLAARHEHQGAQGNSDEKAKQFNDLMLALARLTCAAKPGVAAQVLTHLAKCFTTGEKRSIALAQSGQEMALVIASGTHDGDAAILAAATKILRDSGEPTVHRPDPQLN